MRILGIDPGTRITGFGVIDKKGSDLKVIDYGIIQGGSSRGMDARLKAIYKGLSQLIARYRPDEVVLEKVFYAKDVQATIKIGEARGVALLCAADKNRSIYEYSPAEVKKAVTGNGRAHKSQVQEMVKHILGLMEIPRPDDAADALALVICHAHRSR